MTDTPRTQTERISAWLDGALDDTESAALQAQAATDPALAAELEALANQDVDLIAAFDSLLDAPIPEDITRAALTEPSATPAPANLPFAPWRSLGSLAAALALLVIGGGGTYLTRTYFPNVETVTETVEVQPGWMAQVASYHRVYARQARHLVEVPASEKDHIEAWLGAETGVDFSVPDLASAGFAFEGARLLVAAGKPVVQLLYSDEAGAVLALCALQSDREAEGFETRQFGEDVTMVRWAEPGADWVAVGTPQMDLETVAALAEIAL